MVLIAEGSDVSGSNFWKLKRVLLKGFAKYTTKIAKYTTQFLKDDKKGFAKYTTKIAKYTTQIFNDENC